MQKFTTIWPAMGISREIAGSIRLIKIQNSFPKRIKWPLNFAVEEKGTGKGTLPRLVINNAIKNCPTQGQSRDRTKSTSFVPSNFCQPRPDPMFQKDGGGPHEKGTRDAGRARVLARVLRDRNKWNFSFSLSSHSILLPRPLTPILPHPSAGSRFRPFLSAGVSVRVLLLWVTTPVRLCNARVGYILWQMYKDLSLAISPGKSRATPRATRTFRQVAIAAEIYISDCRERWGCPKDEILNIDITPPHFAFRFKISSLKRVPWTSDFTAL